MRDFDGGGESLDQGAAQLRGPDLTGWGSRPMVENPPLQFVLSHRGGPFEPLETVTPRRNAVVGRSRRCIWCRDCGERFGNRQEGAKHAARKRHVVVAVAAAELVPVDQDDDWREWDDGAGVCWNDRNPERGV